MTHRNDGKKSKLSDETIQSVIELGVVLRQIHNRLVAEGKVKVVNGKIVFLNPTSAITKKI